MKTRVPMADARSMKAVKIFSTLWCALALVSATRAAELTRAQSDFFENKVRPVLVNSCYKCHSTQSEKLKGGLLLDTREGLLKGGETGPALVPGNPEKSLLITAVRYADENLQMPPKEKLSEQQIADLATWIRMGAPDPRLATDAQKNWKNPGEKHWAWQPVKKPAVPVVKDHGWSQTPIDNFIVAKLDEKGMKPNPIADKPTLIRRAYYDLIGLPPTPAQVDKFVNDKSSNAFEKVIDELLASPHYGERWGRHWLDTARYADTKGEVKRQREDERYPFAWTYRDYVIRSLQRGQALQHFRRGTDRGRQARDQFAEQEQPRCARFPDHWRTVSGDAPRHYQRPH